MRRIQAAFLTVALCFAASTVAAESVTLDVVLSAKDEIRLDFKDESNHFVALTQRAGTAEGGGAFAGAEVVEYGLHDVIPGDGGNATGYLEATTRDGDVAYFKWHLRAFFVAGDNGDVRIIDNGHWELAGGTGQFASMRGVGTLLLEFVSKTERRYLLEGDISPRP
jgi:hypothetical protein